MECDDSKLYSMFLREFSGTVTKANPAYVETRLHGQVRMTSATEYPYPSTSDRTKHKGDLKHLKVLAGMRISMYNQVRTVVRDISSTKSAIELLSNTEVRGREARERERERQAGRQPVGQLGIETSFVNPTTPVVIDDTSTYLLIPSTWHAL